MRHVRAVTRGVLLLALLTSCGPSRTETTDVSCIAPELVGETAYDSLVCQGVAAMASGTFTEAVRYFDQALAIHLFELPNYLLFPRLALARARAGDHAGALETLQVAEIAFRVVAGILHCPSDTVGDEAFSAGHLLRGDGSRDSSPWAGDVSRRMCGAGFEDAVLIRSPEDFLRAAEYAKLLVEVRSQLDSLGLLLR